MNYKWFHNKKDTIRNSFGQTNNIPHIAFDQHTTLANSIFSCRPA